MEPGLTPATACIPVSFGFSAVRGVLEGARHCRAGACISVNTFELTKQLMSIPSVSGTEGKVGEFLESHLESLGYRVERQTVTQDRFNVIAFAGDPHVMLC